MPKEKRYKSKTKVYHVMSRALNKQMLFDDEHDFFNLFKYFKSGKKRIRYENICILSYDKPCALIAI